MKSIFKNIKRKSLLWFLIVALVFPSLWNAMMIFPAYAQLGPKVFVDPKDNIYYTYQKGINDTFQINVTIANMTGLAGFQFELRWNASLLNGVSMVENLFKTVTPPGETSNIWQLQHQISTGFAKYAYTYQNLTRAIEMGYAPINITTAEGYPQGKLAAAIITLRIIAEPPPDKFLDCILDIVVSKPGDKNGQPITHTVEDGYYKLIAPPIPTPILKVEPETYIATYKNQTFDINVDINNLDEGWMVVGVEFKLRYDPLLLKIINVTEGPFMAAFAGPPNQGTMFMGPIYGSDYVLVGVVILADVNGTWHAPFPFGNGTIATITFQVLQGPSVSSNLALFDTKLGDTNAQPVAHTTQDGVFRFDIEILTHNITAFGQTFTVTTVSNASISPVPMAFMPRFAMVSFNATGADGALCFVNITIPKNFIWLAEPGDEWLVLAGGFRIIPAVGENSTHTWLYFTFKTSLKPLQVIGTMAVTEFPMQVILLMSLIGVSTIATALSLHKKFKKPIAVKNT